MMTGSVIESTDARVTRIASDVAAHGWSVCRDFVSREEMVDLRRRLREWWEEGELRKAGIGRGENFKVREDIRADYVRWLDFSVGGAFHDFMQSHLEPLRLAINRELFLGVYEYEGHVTVYPPGGFYKRHVDQFHNTQHRRLSVILYLNETDWSPQDGGELRLYLPGANGEELVDILPEGGTLATFLSHEIEHEVLPTRRERYSLTGWFRTRE